MQVDAFWSLTMYEFAPDGRRFFTDNPLQRYALGDRTPGSVRHADGSFDIWLQHAAPDSADARANWLPAPAGRFSLALRFYQLPARAAGPQLRYAGSRAGRLSDLGRPAFASTSALASCQRPPSLRPLPQVGEGANPRNANPVALDKAYEMHQHQAPSTRSCEPMA